MKLRMYYVREDEVITRVVCGENASPGDVVAHARVVGEPVDLATYETKVPNAERAWLGDPTVLRMPPYQT